MGSSPIPKRDGDIHSISVRGICELRVNEVRDGFVKVTLAASLSLPSFKVRRRLVGLEWCDNEKLRSISYSTLSYKRPKQGLDDFDKESYVNTKLGGAGDKFGDYLHANSIIGATLLIFGQSLTR